MIIDAAPTSSDPNLLTILITVIGIVAAPGLAYLAARQAAKQADKRAVLEASVSDKNADVNSWDKLVTSLQNELKRLNDRVEDLEADGKTARDRIDALEREVRDGDTKYRIALQYIRDIVAWTQSLLPSANVPPAAPAQIASDLEMH